jgi:hypothetical protein
LVCLLVAGICACQNRPAGHPQDKPQEAFPVLAVFMGCRPPAASVQLPHCPPGADRNCRDSFYWCQKPDGTRHGPWIRLFTSGEKSLQIEYKDGRRHGPWTQWHQNGRKWKRGTYHLGKEQGSYDGWYENGKQAYHHEYENAAASGHWIHWDQEGYKVEEATFH